MKDEPYSALYQKYLQKLQPKENGLDQGYQKMVEDALAAVKAPLTEINPYFREEAIEVTDIKPEGTDHLNGSSDTPE